MHSEWHGYTFVLFSWKWMEQKLNYQNWRELSFSISTVGVVAVNCGSMMTRKDLYHQGKPTHILE